ncbi:arsenate reductase [Enhygromyxa salina]|uniref:Arsenate reductase n=1 Tax=Enhygromyxa salina TaxID=215803 RepID=A0A2S9XTF8_9BACT|nr:ArsC/Spx/MgsR family protein [Enhygromyxa salina]PRP96149.1 arsenate reductase [Enhygromyxa salina]
MLNDRGVDYRYREYTKTPLDEAELRRILKLLKLEPADLLRTRDAANKALGLDGSEPAATLIRHMVEHPTLIQRPIAVHGDAAVVGRPVEAILTLL